MTCVPITPEMAYLLEACRTWPLAPEVLEQLEGTRMGAGANVGLDFRLTPLFA